MPPVVRRPNFNYMKQLAPCPSTMTLSVFAGGRTACAQCTYVGGFVHVGAELPRPLSLLPSKRVLWESIPGRPFVEGVFTRWSTEEYRGTIHMSERHARCVGGQSVDALSLTRGTGGGGGKGQSRDARWYQCTFTIRIWCIYVRV